MTDDKEYQYKYCGCTRHETRHEVHWAQEYEYSRPYEVLVCTECGEEKEE